MKTREMIYYTNDSIELNKICLQELDRNENVELSEEQINKLFKGTNRWGDTTYQWNGNAAEYDWYIDNYDNSQIEEMVQAVNGGSEDGASIIIAYFKYDENGETDTTFDVDNPYYLGCEAVKVTDILKDCGYCDN